MTLAAGWGEMNVEEWGGAGSLDENRQSASHKTLGESIQVLISKQKEI